MTVFRTYLKVLNKNKILVILYTVILIFFAGFNMKTEGMGTSFIASKPDILIVNHDDSILTEHFFKYMKQNSNIKKISSSKQKDALFYRDINYMIDIPPSFGSDFLAGKSPILKVESTGDYQASLADMMVKRYWKVANIYQKISTDPEILTMLIDKTLQKKVEIELTSKQNKGMLEKATQFYNFSNYSLLAGCVFVICIIISSFKEEKIWKRTMVSNMSIRKLNWNLLWANFLFAFTLWIFYVLLSIILIGNVMITNHGLLFILNSFVFMLSALSLAFLIGNMFHNKEAISGLVNVIALGTSFLCGAFVPSEFLPDFVLTMGKIFPSYYFIHNNELIKQLEGFEVQSLQPIFMNMAIILCFTMLFVIITNMVSKRKK